MIDFKHTNDGDIDLSTDDIQTDISDGWHKRDIIISKPGEIIEAPTLGVGVFNFLNDENPENLLRSVRQNFTKDGLKVVKLSYINGVLTEESYYE